MANSLLYGTSASAKSEGSAFDELEPIIDAFLDRFDMLSVIAIDLGPQLVDAGGSRRGGYEGLRGFLMRADVVGHLRSGTLAAIMIGHGAEAARWEAEKVWRCASVEVLGQPRISMGVAEYEYGDSVGELTKRAEKGMLYGRRHGGDKAVEINRSGHMVVSDFHGRPVVAAAVTLAAPMQAEWADTDAGGVEEHRAFPDSYHKAKLIERLLR
ncbi:hypothetical protein [Zavarzinia sp.]|uniref:hypothetical protein n=1 Tax=Zavarzinia sp. TaxID=2027920 RepID=UPI003BB492D7|nr:hypothetical protein [Zavarzinia sp.]